MKTTFSFLFLLSSLLVICGCKPPVKTFSMKVNLVVMDPNYDGTVKDVDAILHKRLLSFGLREKDISQVVEGNRITLRLNGVTDTLRVKRLLTTRGDLGFRETYECSEVLSYLNDAEKYLIAHPDVVIYDSAKADTGRAPELADIMGDESGMNGNTQPAEEFKKSHPLFGRLKPAISMDASPMPGSTAGYARPEDTAVINSYLKIPGIRSAMPEELLFIWSSDPARNVTSDTLYELHAVRRSTKDGKALIGGSAVNYARAIWTKKRPMPVVQISMNEEGAKAWSRMTADNVGRSIAITVDGRVLYAPRVMSEIKGGNSEISAHFSVEEAEDLASIINSGSLPAGVVIENK